MKLVQLADVSLHDLVVGLRELNRGLVPLLAHVTLRAILPQVASVNIIVTQDAREDDLVHVTCHGVLEQQVVRDLVDAHEHECHLTGRLGPFLLLGVSLDLLLNALNFHGVLDHPEIFTLVVTFFEISHLLFLIASLVNDETHLFEVGEGFRIVKIELYLLLDALLLFFLFDFHICDFFFALLNFGDKILQQATAFGSRLVTLAKLPEDLSQIELLEDDVDFFVDT